MQFRSVNGAIEIADEMGRVVWTGQPLGLPVKTVIPLVGEDACVVLCDPDAQMASHFENVMRVASNGTVVWRAPLPTSGKEDCYTALTFEADSVVANSWSGFRVRIDPEAGKILQMSFTK